MVVYVVLRERSLIIGGGEAGKFWGRAAMFWAPVWGRPKFSGPPFNFWAPSIKTLGEVRVLMGFAE